MTNIDKIVLDARSPVTYHRLSVILEGQFQSALRADESGVVGVWQCKRLFAVLVGSSSQITTRD